MKHSLKRSFQRENFKVVLKLSAEISMTNIETDNFLEMLAAVKGTDLGLKIRPAQDSYPYKGVVIEEYHDLTFQHYVIKGFNPSVEQDFSNKIKLIIESFKRYMEFKNHFSSETVSA